MVAKSLSILHQSNLVHGNFHIGNLLLLYQELMLINLGLSKPVGEPSETNEIYGVLPYITLEILRGKPYTKVADIYSFSIIMWEMTSGIPAFNDISHGYYLALKICQGLRPKIIKDTKSEYAELMKKCWDSDLNKRPTADELEKCLRNRKLNMSILIMNEFLYCTW